MGCAVYPRPPASWVDGNPGSTSFGLTRVGNIMSHGPPQCRLWNERCDTRQQKQIAAVSASLRHEGCPCVLSITTLCISEQMDAGKLGDKAAFCRSPSTLTARSAAVTHVATKSSYCWLDLATGNEHVLHSRVQIQCKRVLGRMILHEPHAERPPGSAINQYHRSRGVSPATNVLCGW